MTRVSAVVVVLLAAGAARAQPADLDADPINYRSARADNPVSRLQDRLRRGETKLRSDDDHGYLKSVLKELDVPLSSQVLVFSKTSLQRDRIAPATPRAVYFNDDVAVGFCLRGDVLEVSAADPVIGTAFYTLDQEPAARPRFARQTDACLACHGGTPTRGYPGHLVRSVFADPAGQPVLSLGGFRTDHASPFAERWGGWYVTGTHGGQSHMGNRVVRGKVGNDRPDADPAGQNVTSLKDRFTVGHYLTPHSDLVALMVLEHQVEGHNRLARANLMTRQAVHAEAALNRDLGEPAGHRWDSTTGRVKAACEPVVEYLLMSGEAALSGPMKGTSAFADEFARRGPFDKRGRSLRQFDLEKRLFRHPCSYLVYSPAFAKLPAEAKEYVLRRMAEVLAGRDTSPPFAHLSAADRAAVLAILRDTLPGLPAGWGD